MNWNFIHSLSVSCTRIYPPWIHHGVHYSPFISSAINIQMIESTKGNWKGKGCLTCLQSSVHWASTTRLMADTPITNLQTPAHVAVVWMGKAWVWWTAASADSDSGHSLRVLNNYHLSLEPSDFHSCLLTLDISWIPESCSYYIARFSKTQRLGRLVKTSTMWAGIRPFEFSSTYPHLQQRGGHFWDGVQQYVRAYSDTTIN